jgi:hypothetical protein
MQVAMHHLNYDVSSRALAGATEGQFWTSNSPALRSKKLHELGQVFTLK